MENAQRKLLSAPSTIFWKFVFPTIWISGFGAGAITSALRAHDDSRWIFPAVWILGSSWLLWFALRLRRVALGGETLYISTYRREIALPLSAICRVSQSYMSRPQTICLRADRETPLGQKFIFIAGGWPRIISPHPLAVDLEQLVAKHRSPSHAHA
jgi:hypothetical protein